MPSVRRNWVPPHLDNRAQGRHQLDARRQSTQEDRLRRTGAVTIPPSSGVGASAATSVLPGQILDDRRVLPTGAIGANAFHGDLVAALGALDLKFGFGHGILTDTQSQRDAAI